VGAAPADEELVGGEGAQLEPVAGHLRPTRAALSKPTARRERSVTTTLRCPSRRFLQRDRDAGEAALLEELREDDVARLRLARFVEAAGEHAQRVLEDQAELLVEHHEDAVDVDVPEGQRDLEEVPHVVAEDDVAQGARALLVGAIAERRHRGVVAHEGHAAAFQEARRLDRAEQGTPRRRKARAIIC
jgi:hypothetical protein